MSTGDEWRPVPGYEGRYEVSSIGIVRSLPDPRGRHRWKSGKTRRTHVDRYGYINVQLMRAGEKRWHKVHRLVCAAFNGPPPKNMHAAHLDGNPRNNAADNLIWATAKENARHKILHGTAKSRRHS